MSFDFAPAHIMYSQEMDGFAATSLMWQAVTAADNQQTEPIKAVLYCTVNTLRHTQPLLQLQHLMQSQETETVVFPQLALLLTAPVV